MNISVIVYRISRRRFSEMFKLFSENSVKVYEADNLSRLHQIMESRSIDAIIVQKKTLEEYKLNPEQHLRRFDSRMAFISIDSDSSRGTSFLLHCRTGIQEEAMEKRYTRLTLLVEKMMKSCRSGSIEEQDSPIVQKALRSAFYTVPPKMKTILALLAESGEKGITRQEIGALIWGIDANETRSSIHAYISRLRKILRSMDNGSFTIESKHNRYWLTQHSAETGN